MTTKEFLDKYDSDERFTEEELSELWSEDTDVELVIPKCKIPIMIYNQKKSDRCKKLLLVGRLFNGTIFK